MIFLTTNDFDSVLVASLKAQLVTNNTAIQECESFAITEMKSFLSGRFNTNAIFGSAGTARNAQIVQYAVDLTVYRAMHIISPQNVPTWVKQNRDAAREWLRMVATNDLNPDLPLLPDSKQSGTMRLGGNKRYTQRW